MSSSERALPVSLNDLLWAAKGQGLGPKSVVSYVLLFVAQIQHQRIILPIIII